MADKICWRHEHAPGEPNCPATAHPFWSGDETFTVIMPTLLRARFERWLRREHLPLTSLTEGGPRVYAVHLPRKRG